MTLPAELVLPQSRIFLPSTIFHHCDALMQPTDYRALSVFCDLSSLNQSPSQTDVEAAQAMRGARLGFY
jgi:hypothetical protein